MAKTAFLLLLFVAFWTALTAIIVIAAVRSPPMWSHEPLWEGVKSYLISILSSPVALVVVIVLLACLSRWDKATASGPSDLDRLLEVKRAGLWRLRYRMMSAANAAQASTARPSPSVSTTTTTTEQPPQGSALDRLVSVKRERGWYPAAVSPEDV
jgi:hypothetical protein